MRSKNILSIVAFVAAFGLSVAFASLFITKSTYLPSSCFALKQKTATANAISALIAADHANGRARDEQVYDIGEDFPPAADSISFADYVEATESYANNSSRMNTANLPADFQDAWLEHMQAWRDYSNFLNQSVNSSTGNVADDESFRETDYLHSQEINRTWYKVLQTGRTYGANVR